MGYRDITSLIIQKQTFDLVITTPISNVSAWGSKLIIFGLLKCIAPVFSYKKIALLVKHLHIFWQPGFIIQGECYYNKIIKIKKKNH